jgi:hypothetical protein
MWTNLHKNVLNWAKDKHISEHLFGIRADWWFLLVGLILSAMILVAIIRRHRQDLPLEPSGDFGRGQLLFLVILWIAVAGAFTQTLPAMAGRGIFFVHVTFWITGGACSLIVLGLSGNKPPIRSADCRFRSILEIRHATLDKLAADSRPHHSAVVSYRLGAH